MTNLIFFLLLLLMTYLSTFYIKILDWAQEKPDLIVLECCTLLNRSNTLSNNVVLFDCDKECPPAIETDKITYIRENKVEDKSNWFYAVHVFIKNVFDSNPARKLSFDSQTFYASPPLCLRIRKSVLTKTF